MKILRLCKATFFAVLLLPIFSLHRAHAVPEQSLQKLYKTQIIPYWKTGRRKLLPAKDGVHVGAYFLNKGKNSPLILFLPGRTEPAELYAELAYDLKNSPYSIYILDHRGQGGSTKLSRHAEAGHVESFSDYVHDLKTFFDYCVRSKYHSEVFVVAHSMGATVATHLLKDHPHYADGLVMTNPMFKFKTGNIPPIAGKALSFMNKMMGNGDGYAIGKTSWSEKSGSYDDNLLTNSKARYSMFHELFTKVPQLRIGGPSYNWVLEGLLAADEVRAMRDQSFNVPTLLLSSPKDSVIYAEASMKFCQSTATDCRAVSFPDAKHHLLIERDASRNLALREAKKFLDSLR